VVSSPGSVCLISQVGRKAEIDALLSDVDVISEGGASFRFIVGRYGSGKSFLLQTIRNYVMDRNFAVMDADLSPERKLTGTKGQGLATYRELIGNLATRTKPEGGALSLVLDRWISGIQMQVQEEMSRAASSAQPLQGIMRIRFPPTRPRLGRAWWKRSVWW
jgi:ABC-type glutathione transport system ATPase component